MYRVAITFNYWEGLNSNHYLWVTFHYIDNKCIQKIIIGFRDLIFFFYTAQNLLRALLSVFMGFGIEKKIFFLLIMNMKI